ncbi:chemotaxis protein CheW [Zarconia navalis]|uniref:chemotaxis protein CheW n=1 Tax=Zarconia navalis TaxID=2992134 RepID=UPI0021F8A4A9|nr:chemotaxis protein CheW [Zarconia navalis]
MLEREAPSGYLQEWTNLLAQKDEKIDARSDRSTVLAIVFRLGREWLALRASVFKEVTRPCIVRTLPHRSNEILLGIANIHGEIIPCISLSKFLGIESPKEAVQVNRETRKIDSYSKNIKSLISIETKQYERTIVLEKESKIWMFQVDEVSQTYRCCQDEIQELTVTTHNLTNSYIKGIFNLKDRKVSYLNDDLLFDALDRKLF